MRKKLQIFVSSTFEDLKDERQAAVQAILRNRHIPAGMELFSAGSEEQMKVIQRWIDESDIYMLILGKRYGTIEPKSQKSYTHLEYEYAIEKGKSLFAIIMNDEWLKARLAGGIEYSKLTESVAQSNHADFERLVRGKMCRFASDHKDIQLEVGNSIRELEESYEFSGWVSGASIGENKDTIKLVSDINKKNAELQSEISELNKALKKSKEVISKFETNVGGIAFVDLCKAMDKEIVIIDKRKVSLLNLVFHNAVALTSGPIEATNMKSLYEIASKLVPYDLARTIYVSPIARQKIALNKKGVEFIALLKVKHTQFAVNNKPKLE